MRVLHVALLQKVPSGIAHQMNWEKIVSNELGFDWDVILYCRYPFSHFPFQVIPDSSLFDKLPFMGWISLRLKFLDDIKRLYRDYDFILIRYSVHDIFIFSLLRLYGAKIIFVHHTKEVEELLSLPGFFSKLRGALDYLIAPVFLKNQKRYIAVTHEISRYQSSRYLESSEGIVYPNGILVNKEKRQRLLGPVVELLFISSKFYDWHGLDLLLSSIRLSSLEFTLHLVGELNDDQKKMICGDERIKTHGRLTPLEISDLSQKAWLGLTSFGLFRIGLSSACTLKVREYLSLGLPVYGGYDEVFPESFQFYKKGAPDIDKIIEFAMSTKDYSADLIIESSERHISKKEILKELYGRLKSFTKNWP